MRAQTSGALKAAIDCATRITPERSPIASTTVSAVLLRPAVSSPVGRSGVSTSWPRSRAATRCQYQESPPAAGQQDVCD